jgi:hypothetical protein
MCLALALLGVMTLNFAVPCFGAAALLFALVTGAWQANLFAHIGVHGRAVPGWRRTLLLYHLIWTAVVVAMVALLAICTVILVTLGPPLERSIWLVLAALLVAALLIVSSYVLLRKVAQSLCIRAGFPALRDHIVKQRTRRAVLATWRAQPSVWRRLGRRVARQNR